ncbi:hypothetical protein D5b_00111 [Faustovirus]|nr:hypothetical protein D5b_00111 [Faustovirus]AMN84799.1 hypothetical protein D6_00399 [Faustovirus]AMP44069.1 hypothetical protein PRJ_Dakar_00110 [Faustovirus]
MSILAGISAGETIFNGLYAFLTTTKLADTRLTLAGKTYTLGALIGYKNGFARRLFLYIIACLLNLLLSVVFYTTDIIPMTVWILACYPLIIDKIISCKWFNDLEGGIITHYLTRVVNYLIKHGLDIHTQVQCGEIRNVVEQYYRGQTELSLAHYTSPVSILSFIYKSIKTINTNDTERIIKAIHKKRKIDPVLLWSIYRVWRAKQNFTSMFKSMDRHIGYHVLEYTAVYAALWCINIYAAVATLFAVNMISRHRNAASIYKYNIILALSAIIIHTTIASNFLIDNVVCIILSSGCLIAYISARVNHNSVNIKAMQLSTVVKSSWLWPVLALAMGNRFAAAALIPKFYRETSRDPWYIIGVLMCGYFSDFAPMHIILLYVMWIIYTINHDAALLLRATKVIAEYAPTQFNVNMHTARGKLTLVDNYI